MPLIPETTPPIPNTRYNFIINPTNWLGYDTLHLACGETALLIAPDIPISQGPDTLLSNSFNFGYTLWFTNYEDPFNSLINFTDSFLVAGNGTCYVAKVDSHHNLFYEKAFVILTAEQTSCDDLDPCTINDLFQSDCSCLGTFADYDNDGICDAEDVCDNTLAGSACDDLNPCTINDLIQADCSCSGTFADYDSDGICDAEDTCDNTLAGTTCDDLDPCTINDIIQSDCSCVGTFADADSDGICDTAEIAGCTDSDACNYDANATDDDGSCTYVESLSIEGNDNAVAGIEETYTYAGPASSVYQWSIDPGTIQSGQGTQTVSVFWNDALTGTLQVIETTATNCVGDTITLEVSVSPNAIDARNTPLFTIYPNPVSDILHIAGDIPSNARLSIYNGIGQCVFSGLLVSTIDVHTLAAGVYHLQLEHVGTVQRKKFTIVRGE